MATYEATIGSAWSADDTFSYLAAFSNAEHWDPGVLAGEQLDPGPVRVGSRFRLVVPFLGLKLPLTYRVTQFSAGDRQVVLDAVSMLLRARDRIAVLPGSGPGRDLAGRATVSYRAEVTLRGPLRLLDPALSTGFRTVGKRASAGLASVLAAPDRREAQPRRSGLPDAAAKAP